MEFMSCCNSTVGNLTTVRSIGIARELLAGRHASLFGTRWSGLQCSLVEEEPIAFHLVASASPRADRTSGNRTRLLEDIQSHLRLK